MAVKRSSACAGSLPAWSTQTSSGLAGVASWPKMARLDSEDRAPVPLPVLSFLDSTCNRAGGRGGCCVVTAAAHCGVAGLTGKASQANLKVSMPSAVVLYGTKPCAALL